MRVISLATVLCIDAILCCSSSIAADAAPAKRRYEVRDTVEMAHFGTVESSQRDQLPDDGIVSPDGRHLVKVTHRGVLPEGVTEGTIWLFETNAVIGAIASSRAAVPKPILLARVSAAVNGMTGDFANRGNTISDVAWSDDSKYLTFLGRDGRENRQLLRVEVATRKLEALTPASHDVVIYAAAGQAFAYLAAEGIDENALWQSAGSNIPDIETGTGKPLISMLYPDMRAMDTGLPFDAQVWHVRDGKAEPVMESSSNTPLRIRTSYQTLVAALSPSASQLATITYADETNTALRYTVVDLDTGRTRLLNTANAIPMRPRTGRVDAAWSPDESEVAMSEIRIQEGGKANRCTLAITSVRANDTRCVAAPDAAVALRSFRWLSSDRIYVNRKAPRAESYQDEIVERVNGQWRTLRKAARGDLPRLRLTVRESLNERPVLMATDMRSGKQRMLFDPNPQLDAIDLGAAEVYEWLDGSGRAHRSGLVKPPQFEHGRRYPLVVQTHGFTPEEFFAAGYSNTSNAGRALAARDIVVLQVSEPTPTGEPSWRDATESGMNVYLAAIDRLAADGLIDPKKVGITGYSYTGWTVTTSIVRAPDRFAAAAVVSTDPVTMTGYFAGVDSHIPAGYESQYVGTAPFGEGLNAWMERVPSLASDKIEAAVLFSAPDPWHLISFWDLYAAMRRQAKPVELQYIRSGQHDFTKPLHKLAHQELLVDWFEFWLADREQSDPRKAEQYVRWRALKERAALSHSRQNP